MEIETRRDFSAKKNFFDWFRSSNIDKWLLEKFSVFISSKFLVKTIKGK